MSGQDVWDCFQTYRKDSARQVEKLFGNDLGKILEACENYPNKNAYHGHGSKKGKTDQGENSSVEDDMETLHTYLKKAAAKLSKSEDDTPKKTSDKGKEKSNKTREAAFFAVIAKFDPANNGNKKKGSPTEMKNALTKEAENWDDVDWTTIRNVKGEFDRVSKVINELRK